MADLPQPYFQPELTPQWLDAQRKQQIAQMLMGSLQQSNQTPANWDSMKVVPHRGLMQNIAPLVTALLAGKANQGAQQSTADYYQKLYAPQQDASAPADSPAPAAPDSGQTFNGPTGAINVPGQQSPSSGLVKPPLQQPQNPLIPPGMSRQTATAIMNMPGGGEAFTKLLTGQFTPLEIQRHLRAAGIDPNSPQGQAYQQSLLAKQQRDYETVRGANTVFDKATQQPIFTAPENGVSTTWKNGTPTQSTIPGALEAEQAGARAKTAGTQSATPIKLGVDIDGKDIYGYPADATMSRPTASPAQQTSQKSGAEAGQVYASELSKNAAGATEVRRSISELKNLAAQATPGAANEAKAKLGAFMIAAGADPGNVAKWTGVDTGALQAAQKQTATLAVNSIHSMTSRGTNFDLDTFMRNNPNMNMADPAAFARVADYMNNKASQDIAKQKDFAQWKKTSGVSPDDWETQHTAHWLDTQNQAIDKGQSNSRVPGTPAASLAELQAEARKRGLIK